MFKEREDIEYWQKIIGNHKREKKKRENSEEERERAKSKRIEDFLVKMRR